MLFRDQIQPLSTTSPHSSSSVLYPDHSEYYYYFPKYSMLSGTVYWCLWTCCSICLERPSFPSPILCWPPAKLTSQTRWWSSSLRAYVNAASLMLSLIPHNQFPYIPIALCYSPMCSNDRLLTKTVRILWKIVIKRPPRNYTSLNSSPGVITCHIESGWALWLAWIKKKKKI